MNLYLGRSWDDHITSILFMHCRTSFLRQYYMNKKQKAIDRNPVWKRIGDLEIKHIPAETPKDIKHLENTPLIDI